MGKSEFEKKKIEMSRRRETVSEFYKSREFGGMTEGFASQKLGVLYV